MRIRIALYGSGAMHDDRRRHNYAIHSVCVQRGRFTWAIGVRMCMFDFDRLASNKAHSDLTYFLVQGAESDSYLRRNVTACHSTRLFAPLAPHIFGDWHHRRRHGLAGHE